MNYSWMPTDWTALIGGLLAVMGVAAVIVFGLQGDPSARTLLFTLASAAGAVYVHQRSTTLALRRPNASERDAPEQPA